jgi:hypothetical protein
MERGTRRGAREIRRWVIFAVEEKRMVRDTRIGARRIWLEVGWLRSSLFVRSYEKNIFDFDFDE